MAESKNTSKRIKYLRNKLKRTKDKYDEKTISEVAFKKMEDDITSQINVLKGIRVESSNNEFKVLQSELQAKQDQIKLLHVSLFTCCFKPQHIL